MKRLEYVSPELEVLEVVVEQGFQGSLGFPSEPDFVD